MGLRGDRERDLAALERIAAVRNYDDADEATSATAKRRHYEAAELHAEAAELLERLAEVYDRQDRLNVSQN